MIDRLLIEEHMEERICVSATNLRTGIDLVLIEDMLDLIEDPVGIVLTEREWALIAPHTDRLSRLAGRFAGKEAVLKALGRGIEVIDMVDIEILNDPYGKPSVFLRGGALRRWREVRGNQLEVSITHHKDYAVAMVVATHW